jgi:hypothetical protein
VSHQPNDPSASSQRPSKHFSFEPHDVRRRGRLTLLAGRFGGRGRRSGMEITVPVFGWRGETTRAESSVPAFGDIGEALAAAV